MIDEIIECLSNDINNALSKNEVPISAVTVFNNKIIAHNYNRRVSTNDVTAHAEILVIRETASKLGDWRLSDCDLYVTLEPCSMCKEVIKESRIKNVYYFVSKSNDKKGFYKTEFNLLKNVYSDTFQHSLSSFFKDNGNR